MNRQRETMDAIDHLEALAPRSISYQSMLLGLRNDEPLLVAMDAMIRYAKAYKFAYPESTLGEDGVLGDHFFDVIKGVRGLLNGQGAVAMERNVSTDSKDNGVIESMYWSACELAGLDGDQ